MSLGWSPDVLGREFQGKRVLVTGSSRGIGAAVALAPGSLGAKVAIHAHASVEAGEGVVAAIREAAGGGSIINTSSIAAASGRRDGRLGPRLGQGLRLQPHPLDGEGVGGSSHPLQRRLPRRHRHGFPSAPLHPRTTGEDRQGDSHGRDRRRGGPRRRPPLPGVGADGGVRHRSDRGGQRGPVRRLTPGTSPHAARDFQRWARRGSHIAAVADITRSAPMSSRASMSASVITPPTPITL